MAAFLCKKRIAYSVVMVGLLTRPKSAGYCEVLVSAQRVAKQRWIKAASHSLLLSKISGGTENDNRRVLLELERLAASQLLANRLLADALFFFSRCQSLAQPRRALKLIDAVTIAGVMVGLPVLTAGWGPLLRFALNSDWIR